MEGTLQGALLAALLLLLELFRRLYPIRAAGAVGHALIERHYASPPSFLS